ncbi:SAM-dependent methyltransferase [Pseudohoeflea coraliihabitans]|uniref:Nodulation S family protein n=1 Tax=Pseudohoeflea coraliihabitans TaxID=2860393 RepID=A0ABS6WKE2_9HYPH|nr:SAM-dependent methyltransferase [Pseudohoeflea sp. DP4N28-3]MBW3096407.1 nodulation S family protein [Pseudohoeflea sp. DP4N28-3]
MRNRREHLARLYQTSDDPWNLGESSYEQEKYAATLAALSGRRFDLGIEIGCSVGVLSEALAERCSQFVAVDLNPRAVELASSRLSRFPHASVRCAEVPAEWPAGAYDLIVLSEILYFLSEEEIAALAGRVTNDLKPGGLCVVVVWLGDTGAGQLSGGAALDHFRSMLMREATILNQMQRVDTSYALHAFGLLARSDMTGG